MFHRASSSGKLSFTCQWRNCPHVKSGGMKKEPSCHSRKVTVSLAIDVLDLFPISWSEAEILSPHPPPFLSSPPSERCGVHVTRPWSQGANEKTSVCFFPLDQYTQQHAQTPLPTFSASFFFFLQMTRVIILPGSISYNLFFIILSAAL